MQSILFKYSHYYKVNIIIIMMFFLSTLISGCANLKPFTDSPEKIQYTSITETPTNTYHPGKFVWHELLTPDVEATKKFYGALLGWSFERQGRYTIVRNKGRKIGGIIEVKQKQKKIAEAIWIPSLSVPNVDKASTFLKQEGGTILKGPLDMINRGRGALVADPQGAQLLLLHTSDGDPKDAKPQIGGWLWNEIWTNKPDETYDFYKKLGQYKSSIKSNSYHILKSEDKWRAGIRGVSEKDIKTRWIPSIMVADPNNLIDKIEKLGGKIWLRPGEKPSNEDTALISDNTGALLMIQRWPYTQLTEIK